MSVLVEVLSLIIPRRVLDVSWPGGTDAFRQALLAEQLPVRRQCADHRLVSVMFLEMEEAEIVAALLRERGVVQQNEEHQFVEYAVLDQRFGPILPCPWIEWRRHRDGFTYAWLAGTEPGDMAVPADWEPEQSRRLVRSDIRDEPGRMFPLAAENGFETWLDTTTGRVHHALAQRDLADESGEAVPGMSSASTQGAVGSPEGDLVAQHSAADDSAAGCAAAEVGAEKAAKRARRREEMECEMERILRECGLEPDTDEDGQTDVDTEEALDEALEATGIDLDAIIAELEAESRQDQQHDGETHVQLHPECGGADVDDVADASPEERAGRGEAEPWRSNRSDAEAVIPRLWPVVVEALEERGWRYDTRDGTAALCRVRGDAANYEVFLSTDEQPEFVWCWVTMPVRVPADRRAPLCELLNAVTQQFVGFGHVTMHPETGDVHWRHGIDVEGGLLGSLMVNNMITAGLAVCDRVFPAIMAVAFGGVSPRVALAQMEA